MGSIPKSILLVTTIVAALTLVVGSIMIFNNAKDNKKDVEITEHESKGFYSAYDNAEVIGANVLEAIDTYHDLCKVYTNATGDTPADLSKVRIEDEPDWVNPNGRFKATLEYGIGNYEHKLMNIVFKQIKTVQNSVVEYTVPQEEEDDSTPPSRGAYLMVEGMATVTEGTPFSDFYDEYTVTYHTSDGRDVPVAYGQYTHTYDENNSKYRVPDGDSTCRPTITFSYSGVSATAPVVITKGLFLTSSGNEAISGHPITVSINDASCSITVEKVSGGTNAQPAIYNGVSNFSEITQPLTGSTSYRVTVNANEPAVLKVTATRPMNGGVETAGSVTLNYYPFTNSIINETASAETNGAYTVIGEDNKIAKGDVISFNTNASSAITVDSNYFASPKLVITDTATKAQYTAANTTNTGLKCTNYIATDNVSGFNISGTLEIYAPLVFNLVNTRMNNPTGNFVAYEADGYCTKYEYKYPLDMTITSSNNALVDFAKYQSNNDTATDNVDLRDNTYYFDVKPQGSTTVTAEFTHFARRIRTAEVATWEELKIRLTDTIVSGGKYPEVTDTVVCRALLLVANQTDCNYSLPGATAVSDGVVGTGISNSIDLSKVVGTSSHSKTLAFTRNTGGSVPVTVTRPITGESKSITANFSDVKYNYFNHYQSNDWDNSGKAVDNETNRIANGDYVELRNTAANNDVAKKANLIISSATATGNVALNGQGTGFTVNNLATTYSTNVALAIKDNYSCIFKGKTFDGWSKSENRTSYRFDKNGITSFAVKTASARGVSGNTLALSSNSVATVGGIISGSNKGSSSNDVSLNVVEGKEFTGTTIYKGYYSNVKDVKIITNGNRWLNENTSVDMKINKGTLDGSEATINIKYSQFNNRIKDYYIDSFQDVEGSSAITILEGHVGEVAPVVNGAAVDLADSNFLPVTSSNSNIVEATERVKGNLMIENQANATKSGYHYYNGKVLVRPVLDGTYDTTALVWTHKVTGQQYKINVTNVEFEAVLCMVMKETRKADGFIKMPDGSTYSGPDHSGKTVLEVAPNVHNLSGEKGEQMGFVFPAVVNNTKVSASVSFSSLNDKKTAYNVDNWSAVSGGKNLGIASSSNVTASAYTTRWGKDVALFDADTEGKHKYLAFRLPAAADNYNVTFTAKDEVTGKSITESKECKDPVNISIGGYYKKNDAGNWEYRGVDSSNAVWRTSDNTTTYPVRLLYPIDNLYNYRLEKANEAQNWSVWENSAVTVSSAKDTWGTSVTSDSSIKFIIPSSQSTDASVKYISCGNTVYIATSKVNVIYKLIWDGKKASIPVGKTDGALKTMPNLNGSATLGTKSGERITFSAVTTPDSTFAKSAGDSKLSSVDTGQNAVIKIDLSDCKQWTDNGSVTLDVKIVYANYGYRTVTYPITFVKQ